ncbi:MAG: hypothetical protein ABGY75_08475 [Gemmataceae bacterium]
MTPVPLLWSAASRPKAGHRADENEDAVGANPTAGRFAAADGASEGWASGAWAKHLVGCYAHTPPEPTTFADWLAGARRTWSEPPATADQPWYAQAKQAEGAFATLIGIEVRLAKSGAGLRWKAVAVGDSCLLHVRGGAVVESFPLSSPERFDTTPALIPSSAYREVPTPDWLAGTATAGDTLLLATDAVAAALLAQPEAVAAVRRRVVANLADATTGRRAVVDFLTTLRLPRDDDATLLVLHVPPIEAPR